MRIELEFHPESLLVTPLIEFTRLFCDDCEEYNGTVVCLGWIFWELHFIFGGEAHE